jgi:GT2 family glycosyltransferase
LKLYISVISHRHDELIFKLDTLKRLAEYSDIVIIFRDNHTSLATKGYCQRLGIDYSTNRSAKGFSTNNNLNFLRARELGMQDDDKFILLNPDIYMSHQDITGLLTTLKAQQASLLAPNLYLNKQKSLYDDNLRTYPSLVNFVKNYCFGNRATVIDKSHPERIQQAFWASGAFLIVDAALYQKLKGFDERYYLYCEDLDFCYRALQQGEAVTFLPDNIAIHYRRCASRRFFSRAFFRHVVSVFRYISMVKGWSTMQSCIQTAPRPTQPLNTPINGK